MLTLAGPSSGVFFAGNDLVWTFTVSVNGTASDISGATPRFSLARDEDATPELVTADVDIAITDAANGVFTVTASEADTADLHGTYLYQAQIEDVDGNVSNMLHGWFTFKANIVA